MDFLIRCARPGEHFKGIRFWLGRSGTRGHKRCWLTKSRNEWTPEESGLYVGGDQCNYEVYKYMKYLTLVASSRNNQRTNFDACELKLTGRLVGGGGASIQRPCRRVSSWTRQTSECWILRGAAYVRVPIFLHRQTNPPLPRKVTSFVFAFGGPSIAFQLQRSL